MLRCSSHGGDRGAAGDGQLHGRRPDSARRARHQHSVASRHGCPYQHVLRCGVGAGKGGELYVGQRGLDWVCVTCGHYRELGERAVDLGAEESCRRQGLVGLPPAGLDQYSSPDEVLASRVAGSHDLPARIDALDAWEVERARPPAAAVPTHTGVDVRVVDRRRADLDEHLTDA